MDYQNRSGNKGAGQAGQSEANVDRRDRLRKLALETIDLAKDPYLLRNHLGGLECRLCLTLHTNEGSYLAHTQGKKHQTNLARRAARDARDTAYDSDRLLTAAPTDAIPKKSFFKIGRPGYRITKVREPPSQDSGIGDRLGLLFQVSLPEIKEGVKPIHRFMSSFEQRQEPADRAFQYLLVAAEPYETVAFKIQAREIAQQDGLLTTNHPGSRPKQEPPTWSYWDPDSKTFSIQVLFK